MPNRFTPSNDFERQALAAAKPQMKEMEDRINADLRRKIHAIEKSHAGRPHAEVLSALEGAVRSIGVKKPNRAQLLKIAEQISNDRPAQ